jgi:hypothetical protein
MKRERHIGWMILAAGLLAAPLTAQETAQPPRPSSTQPRPQTPPDRAPAPRINVEFPGGAVRDYVRAVREAAKPANVNVIAPESVLSATIDEISLRDVTIDTAVRAIEWAITPRGVVAVQPIDTSTFGIIDNTPTWPIHPQAPNAAPAPKPQPMLQVLSLRDLVERMPGDPEDAPMTVPADVVLTAVRTAIESDPAGGEPAELKYHADSGLIIVRGTAQQVNAATSVLDRMQTDLRTRRNAAREAAKAGGNLDNLRAEVELSQVKLNLLEHSLSRAQMREGEAGPDGASSWRAAVDKARAELEEARVMHGLARAKLQAAERRATQSPTIPDGRSVVIYDARFLKGDATKTIGPMIASLAALAGDDKAQFSHDRAGMLVVTSTRPAHEAIHAALRALASARGASFEQPKVQADDQPKPTR